MPLPLSFPPAMPLPPSLPYDQEGEDDKKDDEVEEANRPLLFSSPFFSLATFSPSSFLFRVACDEMIE